MAPTPTSIARAQSTLHNYGTRLLKLPPELRNRIYDYVVAGLTVQDLHTGFSLLRACKQVESEMAALVLVKKLALMLKHVNGPQGKGFMREANVALNKAYMEAMKRRVLAMAMESP